MNGYASSTSVSPERSQMEIRELLRKHKADGFGTMEQGGFAGVTFGYAGLTIQIVIPLPDPTSREFTHTPEGRLRKNNKSVDEAYSQAVRALWRKLLLTLRAKLEAVEHKISTIEREFMAFIVMPDGRPLGDHLQPKLLQMVKSGEMPRNLLLPMGKKEEK